MKRQLQGISIILTNILLMIGFGNEPFFSFDFRWASIFAIMGISGLIFTFMPDKKEK